MSTLCYLRKTLLNPKVVGKIRAADKMALKRTWQIHLSISCQNLYQNRVGYFWNEGKLICHWIKYHLSSYSQDTDTIQIRGMVNCDYRNSLRVSGPSVQGSRDHTSEKTFPPHIFRRYWPYIWNKNVKRHINWFWWIFTQCLQPPATCFTEELHARSLRNPDILENTDTGQFCKSIWISVIFEWFIGSFIS